MLHIDVLRHGESELSGCLRGSLDDALTAHGWQQMQESVSTAIATSNGLVESAPWQAIWTSPLQRCANFALDLAQRQHITLYYSKALQEMHFGDWEGQSIQQLYAQVPEQLANFWQQPTRFSPNHAETLADFKQRVVHGLTAIVQQAQRMRLQRILLVSHGGVIKLLKCLALNCELDLILTQSAPLGQLHRFKADCTDATLQLHYQCPYIVMGDSAVEE